MNKSIPNGHECNDCIRSRNKNGFGVRIMSCENDMDPGHDNILMHDLPVLTEIEEMFISRVHVVMQAYRLKGGRMGYKGNVLNIEQDVKKTLETLPLSPNQLPVIIVRMKNQQNEEGFKDFRVRRNAILQWLYFLKAKNHLYRDLNIDLDAAQNLPVDGDISSQLNVLEEEEISTKNSPVVEVEEEVEDEDFCQEAGPEQGGATGLHPEDENFNVDRGYLCGPVLQKEQLDDEIISQFLQDQYGTSNDPIPWHEANQILSDYNHPYLQALAFPTLFPFGHGDVTNKDRIIDVSITESNSHLLKYSYFSSVKNEWIYPFVRHQRWVHWSQNTAERHRVNSQRNYYIKKTPADANMTEEELRRIVNDGGDEFLQLLGRMQKYNANISGSNSYFYKKKSNLNR